MIIRGDVILTSWVQQGIKGEWIQCICLGYLDPILLVSYLHNANHCICHWSEVWSHPSPSEPTFPKHRPEQPRIGFLASGWSEGRESRGIAFEKNALSLSETCPAGPPSRMSAWTFHQLKAVKEEKQSLQETDFPNETFVLSPPGILGELMVKIRLWPRNPEGTEPKWRMCQRPAPFPNTCAATQVKICTSVFGTWCCHFGWFLVSSL